VGLQRYRYGGENLRAIHALAFLAGTLGVPGGGLYYGVPSARHLRRPAGSRELAKPLSLPALARELPAAEPRVRFAWFTCSNFLNQAPDAKAAAEALGSVPTVVAVEGYWTETARRAHIVLPPLLWLEEEDVAASYWHDGIGAVRRVVDPPEGCRSDFDILQDLGRKLGLRSAYPDLDCWLEACLPAEAPRLPELRERGWHIFDRPAIAWAEGFRHPDGKFHLLPRVSEEPPGTPPYPVTFLTLVRSDALHSQLLPEEQKGPLLVRLNPLTAQTLRVGAGDGVRLVSATGELEAVVRLDSRLHPDAAACPRGGWLNLGLGVNEATELEVTDLGEGAAYYSTRVRVEAAAERGRA
jgi:anaerobic selenocysteine-containing dehydrogenase